MAFSEIIKEIKNIKTDPKTLRRDGLMLGGICLYIALWQWWKHHPYLPYTAGLASFLIFFALTWPAALKPLYLLWMGFAVCLGFVMTKVLLFIFFYLILTPIAVIARLSGNRFLDLSFRDKKESYWITRDRALPERSRYENQF